MIQRPHVILFVLLVIVPAIIGIKKWRTWQAQSRLDTIHKIVVMGFIGPAVLSMIALSAYLLIS